MIFIVDLFEAIRLAVVLAKHHLPTPRMAPICQPASIAVGLNLDKSA